MNCKAKGSRRERQTVALLTAQGYRCVKSGASLGVFDVVAIGADDILLVQCKSNRNPSAVELEAIRAFPAPSNARKIVMVWKDRVSTPLTKEIE